MEAANVARRRRDQEFLQLDQSGQFVAWAKADITNVDRFLSNFHRPLQRRQIHLAPDAVIPATGVVQLKSTGAIYLISEAREDSEKKAVYDKMCILHLVSGISGDLCELITYEEGHTFGDDSGLLSREVKGDFYMALEHRSAKKADNSDEYYEANSYIFAPTTCPLTSNSYLTHSGKTYKVVDVFYDAGITCATVLQMEEDYQELIYKSLADTGSSYDVATGTLVKAYREYKFTAAVDFVDSDSVGSSDYTIFTKHVLPFTPRVTYEIVLPNGKSTYINKISQDTNAQGQLKLECSG